MTESEVASEEAPKVSQSEFLEALYGEPLREGTTKAGRNLVIFSTLCAAAIAFDAKLQSSNLFPISFGERTDVLVMLLAGAVLLLLLTFIIRGLTDVLRDKEAQLLVIHYVQDIRVKAASAAAREIEDQFGPENEDGYEPDPWWADAFKVGRQADAAVTAAENKLGLRRFPWWLRRARIWGELFVPIAFGVVALVLARSQLSTFITAVFKALVS